MTGWLIAVLAIAFLVLVVIAAWCVWTATRLDRLHLKLEAADASLRQTLQRRSAVAIELASTGLTDPASAVLLMGAAVDARDREGDWVVQSMLSQTLALVAVPDEAGEAMSRLQAVTRQASIARRIHNDLVVRAVDLRHRRRVRWFHLAGRAPDPTTVEFDDGVAAGAS
jgi:hypothetical protein